MTHNQHFRKREGEKTNTCLCNICFKQKCHAYEITISQLQSEYALLKAYVEHRRGNVNTAHNLLEEDHYGAFSNYAASKMFCAAILSL